MIPAIVTPHPPVYYSSHVINTNRARSSWSLTRVDLQSSEYRLMIRIRCTQVALDDTSTWPLPALKSKAGAGLPTRNQDPDINEARPQTKTKTKTKGY